LPPAITITHHARMRTVLHAALVTLALCGVARAAEQAASERQLLQPPKGQIASPITDRLAVRAMYFWPAIKTIVRYDDAGAPGTLFGAEDALGLRHYKEQGWIDLMFRMTARHRLLAQYYELKRGGDKVLDRTLDFGDQTFGPGDGHVLSQMGLQQLNLIYTYSMLQRERVELGLGFGLHLIQMEGTLEAPAVFKRERLDTAGLYPTLAGDASWRITDRFSANGAMQWVKYSPSRVDASSLAWNLDVQFRAHPNLAVGVGYSRTRFWLESADPDFFLGYLRLGYDGPELFLRASF
jgi:hypothetical protein